MHPAIVCGMVIGGAPVSYWSIFPRVTSNSPRSLLKVNSAQFPSASKVATIFAVRRVSIQFLSTASSSLNTLLFFSQCALFCGNLNSPLPMDIHHWEAVEAAVGI